MIPKIRLIIRDLVGLMRRLPSHLANKLNLQFRRLELWQKRIETGLPLTQEETFRLAKDITQAEGLVKLLEKSGQLRPEDIKRLKEIGIKLIDLESRIKETIAARENIVARRLPVSHSIDQTSLLDHMRNKSGQTIRLNVERLVELNPLTSLDRPVSVENFSRASIISNSRIGELVGRTIDQLISAQLIRSLRDIQTRQGEISPEAVEKALEELNGTLLFQLVRSIFAKAREEARQADERAAAAREEEKFYDRLKTSATTSSGQIVQVVYDSEGNVLKYEVIGRLPRKEAVKLIADLVKSQPKVVLPELIEAANKMIQTSPEKPEVAHEISAFVAEAVRQVPTHDLVAQLIQSSKPPRPATTVQAVQPAPQAAKITLAAAILPQLPEAALPVLVAKHQQVIRQNLEPTLAKQVIEPLIMAAAASPEGQEFIVKQAISGQLEQLVKSPIGQQAVAKAVQAIIADPAPKPIAKAGLAPLVIEPKEIVKLIAAVNPQIQSAKAYLELAVQIAKVCEPKRLKTVARARKQAAIQQKNRYRSQLRPATALPLRAAERQTMKVVKQELLQVLKVARDNNLVIPNELVKAMFTGNLNPVVAAAPTIGQPQITTPNRNSTPALAYIAKLERQVAAARVNQVLPAQVTPKSLKAQVVYARNLIYGLAMQLSMIVSGSTAHVDVLIKELKKRGAYHSAIKAIREGKQGSLQALALEMFEIIGEIPELEASVQFAA